MKNMVYGLAVAAFLLVIQGCSTTISRMPENEFNGVDFERLKRNEYQILGNVTGESCSARYWAFPILLPAMAIFDDNTGLDHPFQGTAAIAREAAYTNAVASAKEADALIAPKYEEEHFSVPPWYFRVCVKFTGKAIKVLTDQELKGN